MSFTLTDEKFSLSVRVLRSVPTGEIADVLTSVPDVASGASLKERGFEVGVGSQTVRAGVHAFEGEVLSQGHEGIGRFRRSEERRVGNAGRSWWPLRRRHGARS